jgi:hypothetical protein
MIHGYSIWGRILVSVHIRTLIYIHIRTLIFFKMLLSVLVPVSNTGTASAPRQHNLH